MSCIRRISGELSFSLVFSIMYSSFSVSHNCFKILTILKLCYVNFVFNVLEPKKKQGIVFYTVNRICMCLLIPFHLAFHVTVADFLLQH